MCFCFPRTGLARLVGLHYVASLGDALDTIVPFVKPNFLVDARLSRSTEFLRLASYTPSSNFARTGRFFFLVKEYARVSPRVPLSASHECNHSRRGRGSGAKEGPFTFVRGRIILGGAMSRIMVLVFWLPLLSKYNEACLVFEITKFFKYFDFLVMNDF